MKYLLLLCKVKRKRKKEKIIIMREWLKCKQNFFYKNLIMKEKYTWKFVIIFQYVRFYDHNHRGTAIIDVRVFIYFEWRKKERKKENFLRIICTQTPYCFVHVKLLVVQSFFISGLNRWSHGKKCSSIAALLF